MDDKVFIYLRMRFDDRVLQRSKIRELAGLGKLLVEFLRDGITLPDDLDPRQGQIPVLEYVDANTERVLISFRVDPVQKLQIVEGCIPPPYQHRMLDPDSVSFSVRRESIPERFDEVSGRLAEFDILELIRETIDDDGNFLVRVPWNAT